MARNLAVLLLILVVSTSAFAERDPEYDRVLDAFKKKRWSDFDARAAKFLEEKPNYRYAHTVRYLVAESCRLRRRSDEAIAAYEAYLEHHAGSKYDLRCRQRILQVLNLEGRHAEALSRGDAFLKELPEGTATDGLEYDRARALEELRRFDEAVAAYRGIAGSSREKAAYRTGVALFRGRKFAESATALRKFLKDWPESPWKRFARDYLFRADAPYSKIRDGIVLDYEGKYADDPRLAAIVERLPALRAASLERIRGIVGAAPGTPLIRLTDAGSDRSSLVAEARLEVVKGEPRQVLLLYTEYLVLGSFDLPTTLTHELYHVLQREKLGEAHYTTPKWVREGTAIWVAGQADARMRILAAEKGRRPEIPDPLARLVNGLGGRHTSDDYAEDVAAFASVAERHGDARLVALLKRLLETTDWEAAIREVLKEGRETFERHAEEHARKVLASLMADGMKEVRKAYRLIWDDRPDEALAALPKDPGIYGPAVVYLRALAHYNARRPKEALAVIREEYYPHHRTFLSLTDDATLIEVKALKALAHPEYRKVAERARKDLEPTSAYRALLKVID
ncbi:MAG: tetratricopeptide repeat protein [Planctomycetota bacterium]